MEKCHHIGIVVNDIDKAVSGYVNLCHSFKIVSRDRVESELVDVALVSDGTTTLEFVQPWNEESPVYGFLKGGGGIHHICFSTDSISDFFAQNKTKIKIIKKEHVGFFGYKTAFFVQRNFESGQFLYELVEM